MKENKTLCCFLILITSTTFVGCSNSKQNTGQPPTAGVRAIYLQARHDDKMFSGEFGDLYLFEYESKRTYRLTDDEYFDDSPLWFPDGQSALFLSNRVGSWSTLKIKGVGSPHEIYRLWLNDKKIDSVDERLKKLFPAIIDGYYKSVQWHPDGRTLLFHSFDNRIYRIQPEKDLAWVFFDIDTFLKVRGERLYNFSLRPDSALMVIVVDLNQGSLAVRTYQFSDSSFHPIPRIGSLPMFGGWSLNGDGLLVTGDSAIYRLDTRTNSLETIIESDSLYVSPDGAFYIDDKNITFLGGRKTEKGNLIDGETEIMQYNLVEKKLSYLTKDGKYKRYLRITKR